MPTQNEKDVIRSQLLSLAEEEDIVILGARDYGSRARDLESSRSDYDVMFIYAEQPEEYALDTASGTIERTIQRDETGLNTEIELAGWDLRKFAGSDGLAGSNPTAIEYVLADETEYYKNISHAEALDAMCSHTRENFKPYAVINHYRSMAASNYGKYIEDGYKLADGASYGDLLERVTLENGNEGQLSVDEEETTIGSETVHISASKESTFSGSFDAVELAEAGLIEETTIDNTIKRYLSITQSLLRSKYVEREKEAPTPMQFPIFVEKNEEWIADEGILTEILMLISEKQKGHGTDTIESERLNDWIESELDREVEPEEYVQRTPNRNEIQHHARTIYRDVWDKVFC